MVKKRKPTDLTLRNLRALRNALTALQARVKKLEAKR